MSHTFDAFIRNITLFPRCIPLRDMWSMLPPPSVPGGSPKAARGSHNLSFLWQGDDNGSRPSPTPGVGAQTVQRRDAAPGTYQAQAGAQLTSCESDRVFPMKWSEEAWCSEA